MLYMINILFSRCPVYMTAGRQGEDNTAGKLYRFSGLLNPPPSPSNIYSFSVHMFDSYSLVMGTFNKADI